MPSVAQLLVRIDATTEQLRRELKAAGTSLDTFSARTKQQVSSVESSIDKLGSATNKQGQIIEGSFNKIGTGIRGIQTALGALGLAMGGLELARGFVQMADAAQTMENRLKTVTSSAAELRAAQDMLYESSQANSVETSTSVELFTRLSRALQGTGADAERVGEMVDTLSKVVRLSGATSQEASGALLQLSQAMGSGVLNGEEFRSMAENLPMLLQAVAENVANLNGISLEQARAELKEMASEGTLTTDIVAGGIENMRDRAVAAYSELETTTAGATTKMWNALTNLVGKINETAGISGNLVGKIEGVSAAFDFGVAALDRYGGSLSTLLGWINSIPHPLSLLAQAAAGAAAQVSQAAGEISAAMQRAGAAREELGSGVPSWKAGPGEGPKWSGNITRKGDVGGLADKLAGGLKVAEATGGRSVSPALTDPMNVAALAGSNVDFTTFGTGPGGVVTGVTRDKPKLKFYKGESKEDAKASTAFAKEAEKLKEQVRTPQEEFQAKVGTYNEMLAKGLINTDDYSKAFREAGSTMQDTLLKSARETGRPAQDLRDELNKRAASAKKSFATAQQEYDAEVANLTELRDKGKLTEKEFAQGVGHAKTELAEANKPKKGAKPKKTEEEKAQEKAEKAGDVVFKKTRTEAEAYAEELKRLDELLARGAITQDEHARAVEEAGFAMQESRMSFVGGQEAARVYLDEIARLDGMLKSGAISQDEYNARVLEAQQKYANSKSSASEYAAEVTRLDQALAAGAISEEEHAASLAVARAAMNEGLQESARLWEETRTPIEQYEEELRKIKDLWASGVISDDTKMRAATQAWEEMRDELEKTNATMKAAKALGDDLGMSFASAFEDAILEGSKLRDIMKGLWEDIQRIVVRQMVTVPLATGLSAIMTGITGAMMGGATGMPAAPKGAKGGKMEGGKFRFGVGGKIAGPGSGTSDSIPMIMPGGIGYVSNGEFVVNARATGKHERLLRAINDDRLKGFAVGGPIGNLNSSPAGSGPGQVQIILENKSSQPLKTEGGKSEGPGPDGRTMIRVMVVDAVKGALASGEFDRTMGARYGAGVQPIAR